GIIFPKYQGDLVQAAVVAERMRDGQIEELKIPHNPLDVLAQQVVAMTAVDDWPVDELERTVRKAAPFGGLTRPVLEAVLDMLAGRYPSEDFAGLRPRIVWDRVAGIIRARPGAQRLAVTSGGTIPDRGLFGVFLASGGDSSGRQPRRGGELDEGMGYESGGGAGPAGRPSVRCLVRPRSRRRWLRWSGPGWTSWPRGTCCGTWPTSARPPG